MKRAGMGNRRWLMVLCVSGCLMDNPQWDGADATAGDDSATSAAGTSSATSGSSDPGDPLSTDAGHGTSTVGGSGESGMQADTGEGPQPEVVWYPAAAGGCVSSVTVDTSACEGVVTEVGTWLLQYTTDESYAIVLKYTPDPEYAGREVLGAEVKLFPLNDAAHPGVLYRLDALDFSDLMTFPDPSGTPVNANRLVVTAEQWVHFPIEPAIVDEAEHLYFGLYPSKVSGDELLYSSREGVNAPALVVTYAP